MKLSADNRESLLATLAPPPGYRVEAALGTTYTADITALTATLLTLAGFEWHDSEPGSLRPSDFITAQHTLCERFRLFFHQGRLVTGKLQDSALKRANLLDRYLLARQQGSVFHPKVWVVKFVPKAKGPVMYRLLCASRNLTVSPAWELAVMMEGFPTRTTQPIGLTAAEFLATISKGTSLPEPIRDMREELKTVAFALPGAAHDQVRLLTQSPSGTSLWTHVPSTFSRAVVVAPFVEVAFLRRLRERCESGRIYVLSTLETLAPMVEDLKELRIEATIIREVVNDHDFALHAKLLLCEADGRQIAYIGSANATDAAWGLHGKNTEAVICLYDVISIDAFLKAFADRRNELVRWLQGMDGLPSEVPQNNEALKNATREVCREARFQARYDSKRGVLTVTTSRLPEGMTISARPFTSMQAQCMQVGKPVEFPLSREAFTRVLVVTVELPQPGGSADLSFVLDVAGATDDLLDDRDAAFASQHPEALDQALLNLFSVTGGGEAGGAGGLDGEETPTDKNQPFEGRRPRTAQVTLERVLRACSSRPEVAQVALRMIAAFPGRGTDESPDFGRLKVLLQQIQEAHVYPS